MTKLGLEKTIKNAEVYGSSIERLRDASVLLPTIDQLANPSRIPENVQRALADVDPDDPHPLNLFRVHWYNGPDRRSLVDCPQYWVVPKALTGISARIVVLLGDRFPMIGAHKVLAAYGCLVPRIVTGQFDPAQHRAIWPSTGNYCRGGIAISRLLRCRGTAILPEGMSQERFDWLSHWVEAESDIVRTPGTESNVKEIYDACNALEHDPQNVIFNQFCEFGNHLVHYTCTGRALAQAFLDYQGGNDSVRLRAFTSATGSAGTIAAGDYLKDHFGSRTVAVEALECPTLLYNGYGEHNIQGIGDKHLPLIHNIMNNDAVTAISDVDTDGLDLLFNSPEGQAFLKDRKGLSQQDCDSLNSLGTSGICNILAAIKTAKYFRLGANDVVMTVATDGAPLYKSERAKTLKTRFGGSFDAVAAAEVFGRSLAAQSIDHYLELGQRERERIFQLGYFTWVEQQNVALEEFEQRRHQSFWRGLRDLVPAWDQQIEAFNRETGVTV